MLCANCIFRKLILLPRILRITQIVNELQTRDLCQAFRNTVYYCCFTAFCNTPDHDRNTVHSNTRISNFHPSQRRTPWSLGSFAAPRPLETLLMRGERVFITSHWSVSTLSESWAFQSASIYRCSRHIAIVPSMPNAQRLILEHMALSRLQKVSKYIVRSVSEVQKRA
jgi:hypothetical protein